MSHPYKDQADGSRKSKAHNMGKVNNLDIPVMRAVGENSPKKLYASSSNSMQHGKQSDASGYKRGGHVGKGRHKSKPKVMVVPDAAAVPPGPDASMAAAGAAPPAPAPSMPPPGPGGPPVPGQPPMARGGRAYPKFGGAAEGPGRLALSKLQAKEKK